MRLRHRDSTMARKWSCISVMLVALVFTCAAPPVRAQFAVIDVASVAQLISQAQTLLQQLDAVRTQINQAQTLFQSMTGPRGMQQLVNTETLNYLPTSLAELTSVEQGNPGAYANLAAAIDNAMAANAVLSPAQLSSLSPAEQSSINKERMAVALLQGVAQQALSDSSNRFTDIQTLISAIPNASDQKAVLELQAAISTETSILQGEQSKLQVLYQVANAQERGSRQTARELIVTGHGQFQQRFEPGPP